ncbi:hypothetical protein Agub_g348 [Astrephomene gubernaculifera]|uniref:Uncharacterized protein n=1 Tax=Astrephomene gubernaculifera TaxID=47775 RepID=A0AAD3DDJ4_9CHLO|nr:hypothetical protein Agub_g348 [Astrephomene gubernaculifera]
MTCKGKHFSPELSYGGDKGAHKLHCSKEDIKMAEDTPETASIQLASPEDDDTCRSETRRHLSVLAVSCTDAMESADAGRGSDIDSYPDGDSTRRTLDQVTCACTCTGTPDKEVPEGTTSTGLERDVSTRSGKVCDLIVDMAAASAAVSAALTGIPVGPPRRSGGNEVTSGHMPRQGELTTPQSMSGRRTNSQPSGPAHGISALLQSSHQSSASPHQYQQQRYMWAHSQPHPQFSMPRAMDPRRQSSSTGVRAHPNGFPRVVEEQTEEGCFGLPAMSYPYGSFLDRVGDLPSNSIVYKQAMVGCLGLSSVDALPAQAPSTKLCSAPAYYESPFSAASVLGQPYLLQQQQQQQQQELLRHYSGASGFLDHQPLQPPRIPSLGLQHPSARPISEPQHFPQHRPSALPTRVLGLSQSYTNRPSHLDTLPVLGMGNAPVPQNALAAAVAAATQQHQQAYLLGQAAAAAVANPVSAGAAQPLASQPRAHMQPSAHSPTLASLQGALGLGGAAQAATGQPFLALSASTGTAMQAQGQLPMQLPAFQGADFGVARSVAPQAPAWPGMQSGASLALQESQIRQQQDAAMRGSSASQLASPPQAVAAAVQQQLRLLGAAGLGQQQEQQLLQGPPAAVAQKDTSTGISGGGSLPSKQGRPASTANHTRVEAPVTLSSAPAAQAEPTAPAPAQETHVGMLSRFQEALSAARAEAKQQQQGSEPPSASPQRLQREQELLRRIADALLESNTSSSGSSGGDGSDANDASDAGALLVLVQQQQLASSQAGMSEVLKSGLLVLARAAALMYGPPVAAGSAPARRQERYDAACRLLHSLAVLAADDSFLTELNTVLPKTAPGSAAAAAPAGEEEEQEEEQPLANKVGPAAEAGGAVMAAAGAASPPTPSAMAAALAQVRAEASRAALDEREQAARQLLAALKSSANAVGGTCLAAGGGGSSTMSSSTTAVCFDDASSCGGSMSGSISGTVTEGLVSRSSGCGVVGSGAASVKDGGVVSGSSQRNTAMGGKQMPDGMSPSALAAAQAANVDPSANKSAQLLNRSYSAPARRNERQQRQHQQQLLQQQQKQQHHSPFDQATLNPLLAAFQSSGGIPRAEDPRMLLASANSSLAGRSGAADASNHAPASHLGGLDAATLAQLLAVEDAEQLLGAAAAAAAMGAYESDGLSSEATLASLLESFSQLSPMVDGSSLEVSPSFGAPLVSPPLVSPPLASPAANPLALQSGAEYVGSLLTTANGSSNGGGNRGRASTAAAAANSGLTFAQLAAPPHVVVAAGAVPPPAGVASQWGLPATQGGPGKRFPQHQQQLTQQLQLQFQQPQGRAALAPIAPAPGGAPHNRMGAGSAGAQQQGMEPSTFLLRQEQRQLQKQMLLLQQNGGGGFAGPSVVFAGASPGAYPLAGDALNGSLDPLQWDPATLQAALQLLQAPGQQLG